MNFARFKKRSLHQPLPFKGLRELLPPFQTKNSNATKKSTKQEIVNAKESEVKADSFNPPAV
ncbi:unnamed protein product, partial [Vitis vinifera]|uniref:Uncharacterized protein n=1 Tax=Vitis vinifera TaxID=29760 RepID=D7UDJ5_VITVI